jgi:CheY-like chemotaxis protein
MPIPGRPLILVVEDEAIVRMHGCDMLESAGFEVIEAGTADEAVTLLEEHDDVRLIFSDIDMPGSMDGLELAALVHDRWPRIGFLITSGHRRPCGGDLPDEGQFIAKPWQEDRVVGKIRSILQSKTAE